MRSCRLSTVMVSVLAFALAGCGSLSAGGDGGGDDDDDDVTGDGGIVDAGIDAPPGPCERSDLTIDEFLDCTGEAANGIFERCTGDIGSTDFRRIVSEFSFFGDLPIPVGKAFFPDAVAHDTITYDPEAAQACLEVLRSVPCYVLFSNAGGDVLEACAMFRGQLAAGASCFNDLECTAVGSRCEKPGGAPLCEGGFCVAPVPLNGSCGGGQDCVGGTHCVNGFCASGEQNAPCSGSDNDCDGGFWCNATVCSTDFQPGADCTREAQCPGGHACVGEDPDTGAAGNCVDVRVAGNACDLNGTQFDFTFGCLDAMYCDVPLAGDEGVCNELPVVGETCQTSNENDQICPFMLACDDAQCANRGNAGDPCDNSGNATTCNLDLFCTTEVTGNPTGQCAVPQTSGSNCNNDGHCASGICGTDNRCAAYSSCFL